MFIRRSLRVYTHIITSEYLNPSQGLVTQDIRNKLCCSLSSTYITHCVGVYFRSISRRSWSAAYAIALNPLQYANENLICICLWKRVE
jgi:hypothetical protein